MLTGSLTDVIIICVLYAMSPDDLKQSEEIRTTESFLYLLKIKFFISSRRKFELLRFKCLTELAPPIQTTEMKFCCLEALKIFKT